MDYSKIFKKKFKKIKQIQKNILISVKINDEICDKHEEEINILKEKNKLLETYIRDIERKLLDIKHEHDYDINYINQQLSNIKKDVDVRCGGNLT